MRVMVMVRATKESEAGVLPGADMLSKMGAYNDELVRAGVLLAAEGLHPSSKGLRLAPFAEGAEFELRSIMEAEDFKDMLTAELRRKEQLLRQQLPEEQLT